MMTTLSRFSISSKLKEKNKQIKNFCSRELKQFDNRLVVIKTSQWEYQDGSEVVRDETKKLLSKGDFLYIDEVLLIYDVEDYDWLR